MVEKDLLSIELVALCAVFPNAIRKQVYITCKAQTNWWQQVKFHKLHLGLERCLAMEQLKSHKLHLVLGLVLKNRAILDGRKGSIVNRVVSTWSSFPK